MNTDKPTKKQTELLAFIRQFTDEHNYSPSYREIQAALGLRSVSAVAEHVENCVQRGFLRKIPNAARSLEIIDHNQPSYVADIKALIDKLDGDGNSADADTLRRTLEILSKNR